MTTLPSMSLVLPVRGAAGSGTWHNALDAALTLIDGHDHSPGKGPRINTDGIAIDDDLSFSSLYAPTALHRVSFSAVTTLTSNNRSLFVSATDNELYFRNNSGTNIKLTSGTSLNVAAFTGGIGGDYASVGAEVAFDDAGDRYTFKQNSATGWARLASGEVRILETGSGDSVYVGLAAPAALAASHTITLPLAAPAATHPLQMTSAGVVTETGSIAMAANEHITVSGTGEYKHGARTLLINAAEGQTGTDAGTAATFTPTSTSCKWAFGISVLALDFPVRLIAGDRITGWKAYVQKTSGAGTTLLAQLRKHDPATDTVSTVGAQQSSTADNPGFISFSQTGLTETAAAGASYFIQVISDGTTGNFSLGGEITYDHP